VAVTIRLARHGRNKRPFYRIVVCDKQRSRDGRFIEIVGTMNPLKEPALVELKQDRVKHWITAGALPSDTVASIINKEIPGYLGDLEKGRDEKIRSRRAKRKAAGKGKAGEKSEAKVKRKSRAKRVKPEAPKKKEAAPEEAEDPNKKDAAAEEAPKTEAPKKEANNKEAAPKEAEATEAEEAKPEETKAAE